MCLLFAGSIVSCSKNSPEKRVEYSKIIESRTTESLLNDLYIGCDGEVEVLARVLHVTPSSIERLRKGETVPTMEFAERVNEVSLYYVLNDQNFGKVRLTLDENYPWYEKILDFPTTYPKLFWTLGLIAIILFGVLLLPIFLIAWIFLLLSSPEPVEDIYKDSINVTIEQLK